MRRKWCVALGLILFLLLPTVALAGEYKNIPAIPVGQHVLYLHSKSGNKFFVAKLDSGTELKVVLAHDKLDGARETVQSMCRRFHCIAGVNGDFYGPGRHGGIVSNGHILRTSNPKRPEARLGNTVDFIANPRENKVIIGALGKSIALGMNLAPGAKLASAYTSVLGTSVSVLPQGVIVTYQCNCSQRPDLAGKTYSMRLVHQQAAGVMIALKPNQMALRLSGADAAWFAKFHPASISVSIPQATSLETIGAHPMLLQGGVLSSDLGNYFATSLHPRTVMARNKAGQVWLIAIDSRVSLLQATQIAINLGATEAVNLDGGGSTTFVVHGKTLNNPADQAERQVASAVLVVAKTTNTLSVSRKSSVKRLPLSKPHQVKPVAKSKVRAEFPPSVIKLGPVVSTRHMSRSGSPNATALAIVLLMALGLLHYRLWVAYPEDE